MYNSRLLTVYNENGSPHYKWNKKLSQEELLYYAEEVGNIEQPVIDLNTNFDNITKEFRMVSDELRETKEELTHLI